MNIEQLNDSLNSIEYKINSFKGEKITVQREIEKLNQQSENVNEAIEILTAVLGVTQQGVIQFIEETVTTALQYVYGEDYGFKIEYELKRNQPEIRLYPTKGGMLYDPKFSCGVGVVDVCSFALRYACWALLENRTAPVMLHDEPFRHIAGMEENERIGLMVKKMSEMLGLQIIIITGKTALKEYADKTFEIKMIDGRSEVL